MDYKEQQKNEPVELVAGEADAWPDSIANYEILQKLGDGSLTTVYKVRRVGIDEVFAAKVLRGQFASNPRTAKRFAQEAQKACALNHAHLVSVYETGITANNMPFLICDFVDGGNLQERLSARGRFKPAVAIDLLISLCEGLQQAHAKDVVHRDIKPGNVVFKLDGKVELARLADFGIAKVLPGPGRETKYITPEGDAFGNPAYMSPEQLRGTRLDGRADIYSLGCLMFELLCGVQPFTGKNSLQVALKQVQEDPNFEIWEERGVPHVPGLQELVAVMLAKKPEDRYQSVGALLADLKLVTQGKPITHQKATPRVVVEEPDEKPLEEPKAEPEARRPGLVYSGKMANDSLGNQRYPRAQFKPETGLHITIGSQSRSMSTKQFVTACAIAGITSGLVVGLYIGFMAKSIRHDGETGLIQPFGSERIGRSISPFPGEQYRRPDPESWRVSTVTDDDRPASPGRPGKYYSFRPGHMEDDMNYSGVLNTTDGKVIFWYNPIHFDLAMAEAARNHVDLSHADLRGADLRSVNLNRARMPYADLRNAKLGGATLVDTELTGVRMEGADFPQSHEFDGFK